MLRTWTVLLVTRRLEHWPLKPCAQVRRVSGHEGGTIEFELDRGTFAPVARAVDELPSTPARLSMARHVALTVKTKSCPKSRWATCQPRRTIRSLVVPVQGK